MRRQRTLLSFAIVLSLQTFVAAAGEPFPTPKPIPALSDLRQAVVRYFEAQPGYRPGDLITQDQVEPLLVKLKWMGLPLPNPKLIVEKVPVKNEFLAEQFRTPNGRKFMRDISGYTGGYDRLDRLSRLPHGKQTIRDLIRGPDGYKMIEYMTTAPGGTMLGEQLSNAPGAGDFNAKTGRIYTAEILLRRLEQVRADALAKAGKKKPRVLEVQRGQVAP
jgi:hypothetical protein